MLYDDTRPSRSAPSTTTGSGCLHLLPPGAGDGGAGRADAAHGRRAHRAGDRPCLPGAGDRDGPADHPREDQDQGGPHPLPGAGRARISRRASPACSPSSSWSSTRATWRPAPTPTPSAHDLTAEAIRLTRLIRAPDAGRRRGGRPAGADAPHRGPPHRAGLGERRAGHPRRAGPRRLGRDADRRGPRAGPRAPRHRGGAGSLPDPRRDQRRAHRRPRRARHRLVAGRRALRPARAASTRRRSSPSTERSRSPSSTARTSRWPIVDRLPRWTATTPSTRPAPTCCAGSAAATRRERRTTGPSHWRATPPRPPT